MRNAVQQNTNNLGTNDHLSKQQKNALRYWNGARGQLEKTSRSVLDLFLRNKDNKNYAKYETQYDDFKSMRNILSGVVDKSINSNDLKHMEEVIASSVKMLKDMVYLRDQSDQQSQSQTSMDDEYDEALSAVTNLMAELRKRLQIIDKRLSLLSSEMTFYTAMGKELQQLTKSTVQAKKEKRGNVAGAVIALAPDILSYIQKHVRCDSENN